MPRRGVCAFEAASSYRARGARCCSMPRGAEKMLLIAERAREMPRQHERRAGAAARTEMLRCLL